MQSNPGHHIRRANRSQILALLAGRQLFRSELSAATGLTGAAVSRITRELIEAGMVRETVGPTHKRAVGRRSSLLSIAADGAYVLAVTLSANRLEVALYNAQRQQLGLQRVDARLVESPDLVINKLIKAATELVVESGINSQRLLGVGISVAVNSPDNITVDGRITSAPLGWQKVAVSQPFESALSVPTTLQPRASSLLGAEMSFGNHTDAATLVLVNVGVGVGAAAIARADVFRHSGALVGLAHVAHPASSIACSCGRQGCLEYCASGVSVVRDLYAQEVGATAPFLDLGPWLAQAHSRATAGDSIAKSAFFQAGERMATGIDIAQALMIPDRILLAGSTGRQPDFVAGVCSGLKKLRSPLQTPQLGISDITSADAAAWSALQVFMFSDQGRIPDGAHAQQQGAAINKELAS